MLNSLKIYIDGIACQNYDIDSKGMITLPAKPYKGSIITADYMFDVPVRFDNDYLDISIEKFCKL